MNPLVAIALVAIALTIAARVWIMSQVTKACRSGAEKIYDDLLRTFSGEHVYRASRHDDFPDLDEREYQRLAIVASDRDFRFLGSMEDLTVSQTNPEHRTRIDCYVSGDGITTLCTYRLRGMQIYDLCSTFQGSRFVMTTNAEANKLDPAPGMERTTLPQATPPEELLSQHATALARYRSAHAQAMPQLIRTFDDLLESARLITGLISNHRRSIGFLTEAELKRLGQGQSPDGVLKVVWREFEKVREERRAA